MSVTARSETPAVRLLRLRAYAQSAQMSPQSEILGQACVNAEGSSADWARLPREEREKEPRWYHENFNSPDDLAVWPPELGGGGFAAEPWLYWTTAEKDHD